MILSGKRVALLLLCATILLGVVSSAFLSRTVTAAELTSRSLTLQAGTGTGGSQPGAVVKHLFGFTTATTGNVGSIAFLYCTTAGGTCTTPTGLVTTSATLSSQTGATGFSIVNSTNGDPYITRTAASISSGTALTYQFSSVTNPTATNTSFYVRISTYASTDTTGATTDSGTVAASTATQIVLTGTMPESLIFCAGGTITNNGGGIPDCSTASSGSISFNQLFSPADTATATSQMAASTNATTGYVITVNGATLTSGANTVTPMSSGGVGVRGTSQFGLNLVANTTTTSTPAIGANIYPSTNGSNYKGEALAGFSTTDSFKFSTSGNSIADSANAGAGPSDIQTYTVSYIVNVNGAQAIGTYTTTLTYICTATY